MRVDLVDPPAYSPPYDHALAAALARAGASVRLVTSRFAYGQAPEPDGYTREEFFYRHAVGSAGSRRRAVAKRAEHLSDMARYRTQARHAADVVHFQWLTVPRLDLHLLPRQPLVLTIHDPLERSQPPRALRPARTPRTLGRTLNARDFERVDAIIVHSQYAREQVVAQHNLDPARVHVIRHGVLGAHALAGALPPELRDDGSPVVLTYGLLRPYKGVETLLKAWHGIAGAQLWVVGRPMMDISGLLAAAPPGAQLVPRFIAPQEEAALFERADVVALPYERSERFGFSGVLATALGHGKAIVLSDIGAFAELSEAADLIPPGDPDALHAALAELIADPGARDRLEQAASRAAAEVYSWEAAAAQTLALYETIVR